MSYTREVYCTACSVLHGENGKKVYHSFDITKEDIKPCRYRTRPSAEDPPEVSTYIAQLTCPVKNKKICTFIKKSNAEELLQS